MLLRLAYMRRGAKFIFSDHNVRVRRWIGLAAAGTAMVVLVLAQAGGASLASLGTFFFGPKLVRAEVITSESGVIHDYRVDRGRIRAIGQLSLTLLEKDGTTVVVQVAPNADIRLSGVIVPFSRLRRGFIATTVRDGPDAAASIVQATRR
jgi:hypothetical protein